MLAFANVLARFRSGLAQWPVLSRGGIALLLGALAVDAEARASGVSVGPGGHIPLGTESQWSAEGNVETNFGNTQWTLSGTTSQARIMTIPNTDTSFDLENFVVTQFTGSTASLKAASRIQARSLSTGVASAMGWATAILNDRVTVKTNQFGSNYLRFDWQVSGRVFFNLQSEAQALNSTRGFRWAHVADAYTFAQWTDPANGQVSRQDFFLAGIGESRQGTTLTTAQDSAQEFLYHDGPGDQTIAGSSYFAPQVLNWSDQDTFSNPQMILQYVSLQQGVPIDVMLGLATKYNVVWNLTDFGGLDSKLESDFGHTATLQGVTLLNSDYTPFTGAWTLESQNGYDYPEMAPVPEPSMCAIALSGLACGGYVVLRRRRRA